MVLATAKAAFSVQEVARFLGLSDDTVYALLRAGRIPHKRLGRKYIIPVGPFNAWLESVESGEPDDGR